MGARNVADPVSMYCTDAVNAVRAAATGGILPGGGAAYIHAARTLSAGRSETDRAAMKILDAALAAPARRIAENAGYDGRMATARIKSGDSPAFASASRIVSERFSSSNCFGDTFTATLTG